jgi:hypothetical protein
MNEMRYQLVLQWSSSGSLEDYDALVGIGNLLIQHLTDQCVVDGHDAGSGESNVFILTDDPRSCFQEVRKTLADQNIWLRARVAYREITGDEYTILWPKNLDEFTVA